MKVDQARRDDIQADQVSLRENERELSLELNRIWQPRFQANHPQRCKPHYRFRRQRTRNPDELRCRGWPAASRAWSSKSARIPFALQEPDQFVPGRSAVGIS